MEIFFDRATVEEIPSLISIQNESFSGDTELFGKEAWDPIFSEVDKMHCMIFEHLVYKIIKNKKIIGDIIFMKRMALRKCLKRFVLKGLPKWVMQNTYSS